MELGKKVKNSWLKELKDEEHVKKVIEYVEKDERTMEEWLNVLKDALERVYADKWEIVFEHFEKIYCRDELGLSEREIREFKKAMESWDAFFNPKYIEERIREHIEDIRINATSLRSIIAENKTYYKEEPSDEEISKIREEYDKNNEFNYEEWIDIITQKILHGTEEERYLALEFMADAMERELNNITEDDEWKKIEEMNILISILNGIKLLEEVREDADRRSRIFHEGEIR